MSPRRIIAFLVPAVCGLFLLHNLATYHPSYSTYTPSFTSLSTPTQPQTPYTKILQHAPGFTVFQNVYFRNGHYLILTNEPWAFPEMKLIAADTVAHSEPLSVGAELYAVRSGAIAYGVGEDRQLGRSVAPEEVDREFGDHEVLEGVTLLNNDDNFVNHYYHWIGETFIAIWRIWNAYAFNTNILPSRLPEIDRVVFLRQQDGMPVVDGKFYSDRWRDRAGLNEWFTMRMFPHASIESGDIWGPRLEDNKLYRFETLLLADRTGGHRGPSAAYKPFGDAFRTQVHPSWLQPLRQRLLKNYNGPIPSPSSKRLPVITYLSRQNTGRRLTNGSHEDLVANLKAIEGEGLAEYVYHTFEGTEVEDQIAMIQRTDILVAVHGNGLTHTLWMEPTSLSHVFEIQTTGCRISDYSPLAYAAGIPHVIVNGNEMCNAIECGVRGCTDASINSVDIEVDGAAVARQIRRRLKGEELDYMRTNVRPG